MLSWIISSAITIAVYWGLGLLTGHSKVRTSLFKVATTAKTIHDISDIVVRYVEQQSKNKQMTSEEKKQLAVQTIKQLLNEFHLPASDTLINIIIESSVYLQNLIKK